MKHFINIIILVILMSGCRSQSEVGFYISKSCFSLHPKDSFTRINIRDDSTFEYIYYYTPSYYHEIGKYQRIDHQLKFFYIFNKKESEICGYKTIKYKLEFNPPIVVTMQEPVYRGGISLISYPTEILIKRNKLFIAENKQMVVKPSDKIIKLRKVKEKKWNKTNATLNE